jgi:RNA polymerase sigma factor (TIGR02999 family)
MTIVPSNPSAKLREHADRLLVELRRYAKWALQGEADGHSFQTSDLIQETWLKLVELENIQWNDHRHLVRTAAIMMRRVLVDHARRKKSIKRSGHLKVSLDEAGLSMIPQANSPDDSVLIDLAEAFERLESIDPLAAEVAHGRVFAGMELAEIAEVTDVSVSTVKRKWNFARTWLHRELHKE